YRTPAPSPSSSQWRSTPGPWSAATRSRTAPNAPRRRGGPAKTVRPEGSSPPLESPAPPHVRVSHGEDDDERDHLEEPEDAQLVELHGPRIEGRGLDVEDHEQHRDQ